MPSIRRCPNCNVIFPTIDALNDHYNQTSHMPHAYNCEACQRAFKTPLSLQSHMKSKHHQPKTKGKTPPKPVVAKNDVDSWKLRDDDWEVDSNYGDVHAEWLAECGVSGWGWANQWNDSEYNGRSSTTGKNKTPAKPMVAKNDGGSWEIREIRRDDDWEVDYGPVHAEWLAECGVSGWGWGNEWNDNEYNAPSDDRSSGSVKKNKLTSATSNQVSTPLPSVSKPVLPSPSSSKDLHPSAGPSLSKSDEAAARARAALQGRFEALGVSKLNATIDLLKSDIHHTGNVELSAPKLGRGSYSTVARRPPTNSTKLPLNSLDNTTHPFTCPGCHQNFKLFSGFVLHIENRSCKSSMCHEIEDRISACATQLFDSFTS